MDAVHTILDQYDTTVTDMTSGEIYTVEQDADARAPLVIEKLDRERLSVAHYYTQRGDLISYPEVVFRIHHDSDSDGDGDRLTPIRYTDHSVVPHHHEHDPEGIDIHEFLAVWGKNLRRDGYIAAARQDQRGGSQ